MMQISSEKLPVSELFRPIKENRFFVISVLFLILGMFFGSVSVNSLGSEYAAMVDGYIKSYISFRSDSGFFSVFFSVFLSGIVTVTVITVAAFGVGGLPVLPLVVFFRGFGTCVLAGTLYRNYSLQGIAFADLVLLPACLVTDYIILYFSGEAMKLSWKFLELVRDCSSRGISIRPSCSVLLHKCLWCMLAVIISSAVEAAFSTCFIKFFNFT